MLAKVTVSLQMLIQEEKQLIESPRRPSSDRLGSLHLTRHVLDEYLKSWRREKGNDCLATALNTNKRHLENLLERPDGLEIGLSIGAPRARLR